MTEFKCPYCKSPKIENITSLFIEDMSMFVECGDCGHFYKVIVEIIDIINE